MLAVVSDSSPLVYLSKLEQFHLLREIYDAVLIPPAVWREVAGGGEGLAESHNLKSAVANGWIRVETPAQVKGQAASLPDDLGLGEREAILLAQEKKAVLLTDDGLGRSVAKSLGLEVTGTLGVLIRGKRRGHLREVRPLIERLKRETNFRMSTGLQEDALRIVGESLS
jgi:predicted nucleic acid-binding protein